MDNKYGRLFTEADVVRLVAQAQLDDRTGLTSRHLGDTIADLEAATGPLTFPADEPLFLLRGQDKAAPDTIAMHPETGECGCYRDSAACWDTSAEFLGKIDQAAAEMREWQAAHPDRTKVPD